MKLLKDKICVVTGSTKGIGLAIARLFSKEGAWVVINGRNAEQCKHIAEEISRAGGKAIGISANVGVSRQVKSLFQKVHETWGRVDILVNNAAIYEIVPMLELSEKQWKRIIQVNLNGVFYCVKNVLPMMIAQGKGVVLNISSIAGKFGGKLPVHHYAASKAAIICLTKSLATEFADKKIRVNAICPGIIDTGIMPKEAVKRFKSIIPLGRLGRPEEVAQAALYLASEMSSYVTGEIHDVNGGLLMD